MVCPLNPILHRLCRSPLTHHRLLLGFSQALVGQTLWPAIWEFVQFLVWGGLQPARGFSPILFT